MMKGLGVEEGGIGAIQVGVGVTNIFGAISFVEANCKTGRRHPVGWSA